MNGWVLLHKKIWDIDKFKTRNRAKVLLVWIWILTHCDEEGRVTFGIRQIAEDCGLSKSSTERALKCVVSVADVGHQTGHLFSTILVSNWKEYQRQAGHYVRPKRNVSETQVGHNKEERRKNKEVKEEYNISITQEKLDELQIKFPTKSVNQEYEKWRDYLLSTGKSYKDYEATFRNWLRNSKDTRTPPRINEPKPDLSEDGLKRNKKIIADLTAEIGATPWDTN